ncbi:MAG: hypothetical protein QW366_04250 [Sulfolobales archaeon]
MDLFSIRVYSITSLSIIGIDLEAISNTTSVRGFLENLSIEILRDLLIILPQIIVSVIIAFIFIVLTRPINRFVRGILKWSGVEEAYKKISPETPRIPLSDLAIVVVDIGLFLLASTLILRIFTQYDPTLVSSIIETLWRFGSFIIVMLLFLTGLDLIIRITNFERKTETLFYLLALFLGIALIIDLTNLSPSIKTAVSQGISVGIGISISIFIIWIFFGEYIERYLSLKENKRNSEDNSHSESRRDLR